MRKKYILCIIICFVMSLAVVVLLVAASGGLRQQPGSFLRLFPPHPALEGDVYPLGYNSYYIAGATQAHVYLGNYTAPLHLLVIDLATQDTSHIHLRVKDIETQKFWAVRVKVVPPHYYVYDGTVPVIYKGNIFDWQAERFHDRAYFQDMEPISSNTFFVRALSRSKRENTLGKLITQEPYAEMKDGLLEKHVDGIFCTEGMLHYEKTSQQLIYLYRYRNVFITLDTNLVARTQHHTLDTIRKTNFKIETLESTGSTTFSTPPLLVNQYSCVSNNQLFVNSMMLAKNESISAHDHKAVIDVYDLASGEYIYSFYLYDYQGKEKLRGFHVSGNKLMALYNEHLQIWTLEFKPS